MEMLSEFARVVVEAAPRWWLLENVPTVPDLTIPGHSVQRIDMNARECGGTQNRHRHFQFGSKLGMILIPERRRPAGKMEATVLATEGRRKTRRTWGDFCELQGLTRDFALPGMSIAARYAAVGNGVHVEVARTLARAIVEAVTRREPVRVCGCNCGRTVTVGQTYATPACRKRIERRRKRDSSISANGHPVTFCDSPDGAGRSGVTA